MDNQLIPSHASINRVIVALAIVTLIFFGILGVRQQIKPDPYVREVLSLEGSGDRGHAIFQINCAGCHNLDGDRSVGPSLYDVAKRKSKTELIEQVTTGKTPPMPKFQPSKQEMADLLTYLSQL